MEIIKITRLMVLLMVINTLVVYSQQSYTWTGAVSQSYQTTTNWSPAGLPGPTDTIIINSGTLSISTGGNVYLGGIYLNNGTVNTTDSVTFSGKMLWNGGMWSGTGILTCQAGASLYIQNSMNNIFDQGTLVNHGTVIWRGTGNFSLNNGAHFKNLGLFEIRNNALLNHSGGNITSFSNLNTGIITKTSSGKTIIGPVLNLFNDGLIEIPNGSLEIRSNGTINGTIEIKNGTLFTLSGGNMLWNPASHLMTNGEIVINAGTYTFNGSFEITRKTTIQVGSTSNFSGSVLNFGDTLNCTGSYVNFLSDSVSIPVIQLYSGNLGGISVTEITQTFNWTGGFIIGNGNLIIPENCVMNLTGDQTKSISQMTLNNYGTILWEGTGMLNLDNGATINNYGLFDIRNNTTMYRGGGNTVTLNNLPEGIIRKTSDGQTTFGVVIVLNQKGLMDIQNGTMSLGSTSEYTGTVKSAESTILTFNGGIHNFNPGFTLDAGGLLAIKGGTTRFNSGYTLPPGTLLMGGELGGTDTITISDTLIWSGGHLVDSGYLKIEKSGVLDLTGYNTKWIFMRKLLNSGKIIFTQGPLFLTRYSVIINNGEVYVNGPYEASICCGGGGPDPKFINMETGRLTVDPVMGKVTFTNFDIDNYGFIDVRPGEFAYTSGIFRQMDGTFLIDSAEFMATREITIQGGIVTGEGLISGDLVNSGIISPGFDPDKPGRMEIAGRYKQNPSGILKIDIGGRSPGSGHDQLTTRSSVLSGNLELGYIRNYLPQPDDKFRVVRWLNLPNTGTFDTIINLIYGQNDSLIVHYTTNNLTLEGKDVSKNLWLQLSGPSVIRPGFSPLISILYGNESPDTLVFPLLLEFSDITSYDLQFDYVHRPEWISWEDSLVRDLYDETVEDVFVYEEGNKVQIPLIVTAPGNPAGGGTQEIHQLDVMLSPKCSEAAGMTASMGDPLSADLEKCLWGVAGELVGFLPGSDCVKGLLKLILTGMQIYSDDLNGRPISLGGILASTGSDALMCASGAIPGLAFLRKTAALTDAIMKGVSMGNIAVDCGNALLPQDGGEKTNRSFLCVGSRDPNEKTGPDGYTSFNYIMGNKTLAYSVFFENVDTATAPAQRVIITDTLDADHWDYSTFSFINVRIGDTVLTTPSYSNEFSLELDMRPKRDIITRINGSFNEKTGVITWEFISLDPVTRNPVTDPLAGFLPPNINPPLGQGSVTYIIQPNLDLGSGTLIGSKAEILFDQNEPMSTNRWENHLDRTRPVSSMIPMSDQQDTCNIILKWTGTDEHSGIRRFFVNVSENNAPFYRWIATSDTFAIFSGDTCNTYRFFVTSVDSAGNIEQDKNAELEVMINPLPLPEIITSGGSSLCEGDTTELRVESGGTIHYQWYRDDLPLPGGNDSLYFATVDGDYVVETGLTENCYRTSGKVSLVFNDSPESGITANGNILETTPGGTAYQWYLNSAPVEGAVSNNLLAVTSGQYQVMVTGINGCTGMSPIFNFIADLTSNIESDQLTIYPNPFSDYTTICSINAGRIRKIEIIDMYGRIVTIMDKINGYSGILYRNNLPAGIYFIRICADENYADKIIIR